jgi:hypothetical protein
MDPAMNEEKDTLYTAAGLKRMGVRKLRAIGFRHVTPENITGDEVYRYHFLRYLRSLYSTLSRPDGELSGLLNLIENEHNHNQ